MSLLSQRPRLPRFAPAPPKEDEPTIGTTLQRTAYVFQHLLFQVNPSSLQSQDTNRSTLTFFGLNGLDVCTAGAKVRAPEFAAERARISRFIKSRYRADQGGFDGGGSDVAHVVQTYSALAVLVLLGEDCAETVDPARFSGFVRGLVSSKPHGIMSTIGGSETDSRNLYSAVVSCLFMRDFSGLHVPTLLSYLKACRAYDGGFGLTPGSESHGGGCYTCLASIAILSRVDRELSERELAETIGFCLARQSLPDDGGFSGRLGKPTDTCYGFWVGAALCILNRGDVFMSRLDLARFLRTTATFKGGYGKCPGDESDPVHTYTGLLAESLTSVHEETLVAPIECVTGVSKAAFLGAFRERPLRRPDGSEFEPVFSLTKREAFAMDA